MVVKATPAATLIMTQPEFLWERNDLRVPSRQFTAFQAEAGKLMASSRTVTGLCCSVRRNNVGGRPIPFHFFLGNGSIPGGHTVTEDWTANV